MFLYHLKRFLGTERPKSVKMFRENVLSGTESHTILICLTHGGFRTSGDKKKEIRISTNLPIIIMKVPAKGHSFP